MPFKKHRVHLEKQSLFNELWNESTVGTGYILSNSIINAIIIYIDWTM
jgi:hypothetical protein